MLRVNAVKFNNGLYPHNFGSHKAGDDVLELALNELKNVQLSYDDVMFVKAVGATPPFKSGEEAYNFIKDNGIKIKFEKLSDKNVHAQWDIDKKTIRINEIYKNTKSKAVVLAITEAIFHEAGHAKDDDGISSIQEEIDCLSLNAMAHRDFKRKYDDVFAGEEAPIVKNGVCLYSEIYFEPDRERLIKKVKNTYGHLNTGDEKHPKKELSEIIKYRNY